MSPEELRQHAKIARAAAQSDDVQTNAGYYALTALAAAYEAEAERTEQ